MRFAQRRREKLRASLRFSAGLIAVAAALVAATVLPLHAGWWDFALPAAIASAIAALILFAVVVNTPLDLVTSIAVYFDRDIAVPRAPRGFGRALYRQSGRLEALASFDSPDPLDTREAPRWHEPAAALPVVEALLSGLAPHDPLRGHLGYLRDVLELAQAHGARFYLLVLTWGGGTNARVEAARRGDLSVFRP